MHSNRSIAAAVVALTSLVACGEKPREVKADSAAPVVRVETAPVSAVEWPSVYEAIGTVRARTSVSIASKLLGYVREVRVRLGDTVKAGQVLIVLDSKDLDAAYRQAQAGRAEAASARAEANNAVASAQANLELAKVTFGRLKDLFDKKSISNQEYDEAAAKVKVAEAAFDMASSRHAQIDARIQQADEAISAADVMRGYTEIRAPYNGTVTEKQVEPGTLAAPGANLLTIEQSGGFRLEVEVDEGRTATVRVGQPVSVKLDTLDRTIPSKISEIVPLVNPASRAITVKIDLPALAGLRAGVYGRALFAGPARKTIAVPSAALFDQGQIQSVIVAENGVARLRLVTAGQRQGDATEILSGLTPGEQVVTPRPRDLADGARLELKP